MSGALVVVPLWLALWRARGAGAGEGADGGVFLMVMDWFSWCEAASSTMMTTMTTTTTTTTRSGWVLTRRGVLVRCGHSWFQETASGLRLSSRWVRLVIATFELRPSALRYVVKLTGPAVALDSLVPAGDYDWYELGASGTLASTAVHGRLVRRRRAWPFCQARVDSVPQSRHGMSQIRTERGHHADACSVPVYLPAGRLSARCEVLRRQRRYGRRRVSPVKCWTYILTALADR